LKHHSIFSFRKYDYHSEYSFDSKLLNISVALKMYSSSMNHHDLSPSLVTVRFISPQHDELVFSNC